MTRKGNDKVKRLARKLAEVEGIGYAEALRRILESRPQEGESK